MGGINCFRQVRDGHRPIVSKNRKVTFPRFFKEIEIEQTIANSPGGIRGYAASGCPYELTDSRGLAEGLVVVFFGSGYLGRIEGT